MRVHELARELSLSSAQMMAKLVELGEFVKSPSSTIEAPTVRRLRSQYVPDLGSVETDAHQPALPSQPVLTQHRRPLGGVAGRPRTRSSRPRREWYRGPQPAELTSTILDEVVIRRRSPFAPKPGGRCRYFEDEVEAAGTLAKEWAEALFVGMPTEHLVSWIQLTDPPIGVDQAITLHAAGIAPDDLEEAEEPGRPSFRFRLSIGNITVEQIVEQIGRHRSSSA